MGWLLLCFLSTLLVHSGNSSFLFCPATIGRRTSSRGPHSRVIVVIHSLPEPKKHVKAYPQQTPHSGRHFLPSHHKAYHKSRPSSVWLKRVFSSKQNYNNKRFMEGWYYRITLPERNASFAFIFSIEDPGHNPPSDLRLACVQIMGPHDDYLVQADRDDSKFWAWRGQQGLGCTFEYYDDDDETETCALTPEEWRAKVKTGFQMLPTQLQGRVDGHDGSLGGVLPGQGVSGYCEFDMSIEPLCGWGDVTDDDEGKGKQKSTAGWLASFAVFEPHWQVTMADGRATGRVVWKNETYEFVDAPFYAEKNWGGAFPIKWYWTQCNAFEGYMDRDNQLAVTAGGGTRKIPFGSTESLGMVSVHYRGKFYEAVPWTGTMDWDVASWGSWIMRGRCTARDRPFEVEVVAKCDPKTVPGVVLRAPTLTEGMVYFCRDSFFAETTLTLWELVWNEEKKDYVRADGPPLIDRAKSSQGGVEIGGGPWWDSWKGRSRMKQPMKGLVQFPYILRGFRNRVRGKT